MYALVAQPEGRPINWQTNGKKNFFYKILLQIIAEIWKSNKVARVDRMMKFGDVTMQNKGIGK